MESSKFSFMLNGCANLELTRLPNLVTVAADVLAGYWIANGVRLDSRLFCLLLATSAVYAGGCSLNEYCDKENDSPEKASRPITSGKAEPWKALILSCALFTVGLCASALAGGSALHLTILLTLATVLYNLGTKDRPFLGPLNIAGYRSLNLILGMGVPFWLGAPGLPSTYFPAFTLLYVFLLAWLNRFEVEGKSKEIAAGTFLGWAHFVTILLTLSFWGEMGLESLPFLALFMAFTGPTLLNAGRLQTAFATGGALKMMILGMPLLNAVYASGVRGFSAGIPVALCTLFAAVLANSKIVAADLTRRPGWGRESF